MKQLTKTFFITFLLISAGFGCSTFSPYKVPVLQGNIIEDKDGVELTLKSFESALDKFGITPIYPINEQFDPVKHEAVMTSQDPEKENNEIENIFQRGWELHERVVRPARVSVIKN